jgi:macrolide transport system ATP-binding/permease protein
MTVGLYALETEMRALEHQMAVASTDTLDLILTRYGEVTEFFERSGGYELDARIDAIFSGLKISHLPRERRIGTLSGGEKSRVGLAALLLQSPDVLLLDEPTNHLDVSMLEWLEIYLQTYRGAMVIVSHDRQFLDRTVHSIIEIEEHNHQARQYRGTYQDYIDFKRVERRKWEAEYQNQQEEIKALQYEIKVDARSNSNYRAHTDNDKFVIHIKKSTHDHTVSRKIRSAEERLARIQDDPIPEPPAELRFEATFDPARLQGQTPLFVSGISKRFRERVVLDDISFTLDERSRIVLVGPNGAGKSTLLKIIAGIERSDSGEVYHHPTVTIGYLDQEQEYLPPNQTLFEVYRAGLPETDQVLKATLIKYGLFRYDDLDKNVHELSSGQKRKLQLARLIAQRANLLILDEPTNAISFDVLEAFEEALLHFPGPVIAASHDRRFIKRFNGDVWEVGAGHLNRNLEGFKIYV